MSDTSCSTPFFTQWVSRFESTRLRGVRCVFVGIPGFAGVWVGRINGCLDGVFDIWMGFRVNPLDDG